MVSASSTRSVFRAVCSRTSRCGTKFEDKPVWNKERQGTITRAMGFPSLNSKERGSTSVQALSLSFVSYASRSISITH